MGYKTHDDISSFLNELFGTSSIPAVAGEGNRFRPGDDEWNIPKTYSINDLIATPLVDSLSSLKDLKEFKDTSNTDLLVLRNLITNLNDELNSLSDPIELDEQFVLFSGTNVLIDNKIFGDDDYKDLNQERQDSLSIIQEDLTQDAIDYFQLEGGDPGYGWDDTGTKATTSNALTLGGNYYDKDGYYADREGNRLEGDVKAPFLRNDGTRLFQGRDDLFEIQQMIVEAGGPAPKRLGYWDEGLADYMEKVLAYANDSRSWEYDLEQGHVDVGQQWRSALGEFKTQNDSGTQLAEILSLQGYATLGQPGPLESEKKQALDDLYASYGLVADASMYQADGAYFTDISNTAAQRQSEIESGGNYLKELILGTKQFESVPEEGEEGFIEYQQAKHDGRVYEDNTGVYIVPPASTIEEQIGMKDPIDVPGTMNNYFKERYGKRIGAVEDRETARENAKLFTRNYITLSNAGRNA
tara:strand:- start:582 stop:1988 length:1407 start_codon:yes stop_codon:yes gene_type:complete